MVETKLWGEAFWSGGTSTGQWVLPQEKSARAKKVEKAFRYICTGRLEATRSMFREYHFHFFCDFLFILRLKNLYTICFHPIISLELNT